MKKIAGFLLVALMLTFSSCRTTSSMNNFQKFLDNHHFQETHVIDPTTGKTTFTATIDSLYDYSKVIKVCDTAEVCVNISRGSVSVKADCSSGGKTIMETLYSLWQKITFFK